MGIFGEGGGPGPIHRISWIIALAAACATAPPAQRAREHFRRGIELLSFGDYEGAREEMERAVALDSTFAEAYLRLGMICQAQGKLNDAVAYYRQATQFGDDSGKASYYLASALLARGDTGEAISALRGAQDNRDALKLLGSLLVSKGEYEEAFGIYERLLAESPDDPAVAYTYVVLAVNEGKAQSALPVASGLVQRYPQNPEYWLVYGATLGLLGKTSQAKDALKKAMSLYRAAGNQEGVKRAEELLEKLR